MFWKEKPARDKKYLAWIRKQDCVSCGWPAHLGNIDCHHIRTNALASKCSDYETVSLCNANARGCHGKADKSKESYERYKPIAERLYNEYQRGNHG